MCNIIILNVWVLNKEEGGPEFKVPESWIQRGPCFAQMRYYDIICGQTVPFRIESLNRID